MVKKKISLIVPVYNEEDNILPFLEAVNQILESFRDKFEFEYIFTDNHSSDKTFSILKKIAQNDNRIKVIRFSKNFGYQKSIFTGYIHASGHAAIQLDCDLQDPPQLIKKFIDFWEQGYVVVYGIRKNRKENVLLNVSRQIFYRLINFLSSENLPLDAGDFRLVDKVILNELMLIQDESPYLRGLITSFGFSQIGVEYDRETRKLGYSKFKLSNLLSLAIDGILNHSIVPLRLASFIGMITSIFTIFGIILYAVGHFIYQKNWPAGFATTTILILFSISLNSLFLGIIGEYLGRIYKQCKGGPLVIIENKLNL